MPELPEVETIARGLAPCLTGRTVVDVKSSWPPIARPDFETFRARVAGAGIAHVRRRAKLLLLDLASGVTVAFHLKMSGRLCVGPSDIVPDKHVHLLIELDNSTTLFFREVRKFGYAAALLPEEMEEWPFFRDLGPEPLEMDEKEFVARLEKRGGRIKSLLLDQRVVAGIGNIYADEALFRARIRPDVPADSLGRTRLGRLFHAVRAVLTEAIAASGSSIRDYRDARGEAGSFQDNFAVYGRAGEPCPACGRPLVSARVAGRTSTFCTHCQK